MKKNPKYLTPKTTNPPKSKTSGKKGKKKDKLTVALVCVAAALLVLLIVLLILIPKGKEKNVETTAPTETTMATEETTVPTETTVPVETGPVMLPEMAALYEQNPDVVGYVRIDGTKLDYPVMYTPEDEEKYLRSNFEGNYSIAGLPFIDKDCALDPESGNLIIYGHNMANGTAFHTLMSYDKKAFWQEHPTIYFSTLYEERTYEIIAAFYDQVYYKNQDVFKFYQFIDAKDEEDFNEAMAYYKHKSLYDTGVTAEYGDSLITLVTCAYHTEDGRFVVVAKLVEDDIPAETTDAA